MSRSLPRRIVRAAVLAACAPPFLLILLLAMRERQRSP